MTNWRKSTYTPNYPPDCVELSTDTSPTTFIRDSKDPHGPVLEFHGSELAKLFSRVRSGALDLRTPVS